MRAMQRQRGTLFTVGDHLHQSVPKGRSGSGIKCLAALTEFENVAMMDTEGIEQTKPWYLPLRGEN